MVMMDAYYPSDGLQEIWHKIDHLHLSYLEMEESPEKLEQRNRLEDSIREFLCIAPHSHKFFFQETGEILHRSASNKKDFSGYKAATGWHAIQLYAGNLLSQPWRKEYRQVKTYCGFYKHQIEANLVGAELMFEAMGYKHTGNGILILDGPICPDTVTNVSKDCLIAYVECQILKAVWEELSPSYKISWLDVLEFRKSNFCSPEQSIRALNFQHHQRQYNAQNSDIYNVARCHQPASVPSFPPMAAHNHMQALPYHYGSNSCCPNNYATYAHPAYTVPVQYPAKSAYTNGFYCTNGYGGQPHLPYGTYSEQPIPTGQLIDLDSHSHHADVVDRSNIKPRTVSTMYEAKKSNDLKPTYKEIEKEKENNVSEDWEYVYRDLESQGYCKDLGERGDILSSPAINRKTKISNVEEGISKLTVADRPLKVTEALEKLETRREPKHVERKPSVGSSYENLPEAKKPSTSKAVAKPMTKHTTKPTIQIAHKERNGNNNVETSTNVNNLNKWECKACTFHNEQNKDICDMCSKSRVIVNQQMEIGGSQCSKCTLVNAKDMKECQACGANLEGSPTYI